ncbi:hypothetical protein [Marinobacter confluentis]|uniref:Uncharacterized protein n=1 Tax=Marinobacter confluentis TaxID=1697557 RepID=A0A4Z1C6P1_9GAMM|nr:hypothetical protein [Marinobacter confluentis]TGN38274.1 hypothetical protein E5Q11_15700 [Marinobacter confluentis]
MFQLVFKGECTPGTDPEEARSNARTLFKANADQITKMFSGQPVVIRNRLEEVQAEKYRGVLKKHGMVAYVEPMEGAAPKPSSARAEPSAPEEPSAQKKPSAPEQPSAPPQPAASESTPSRAGGSVKVEPGDRPNVAGEKVDSILSGSGLTLDPVGVTLAEHKEAEAPMFEHLDEWTLAPPGAELVEAREAPPPLVPDVSHLSLADQDDEPGRNG